MSNQEKKEIDRLHFIATYERPISPNLQTIYARRMDSDWWELHIIVGEEAGAKELQNAWSKIKEARLLLMREQGMQPYSFPYILLEYMQSKKDYASYLKISKEMNFYSLVYLLSAASDSSSRSQKTYLFQKLLEAFQIKEKGVHRWLERGENALKKDSLPWGLLGGPISPRRVFDSLRSYKTNKKIQRIVVSRSLNIDDLFVINHRFINSGVWENAENLLKKEDAKEFQKFELELNGLYNDTIIEANNFYMKEFQEQSLKIIKTPKRAKK